MKIKDLQIGETFRDLKALVRSSAKRSANGKTFLTLILEDNTGTVNTTIWSPSPYDEEICAGARYIMVSGEVGQYAGAMQLKISRLEPYTLVSQDELMEFVLTSTIDFALLDKKLRAHINSLKDSEIKRVVETLFKKHYEQFKNHPAARSMHHDYVHGLLQHTVMMADLAEAICGVYANVYTINHDLLLAGTLIHDIGKVIELSSLPSVEYTFEGNMLGHISIGFYELKKVCEELKISNETTTLLGHMILTHHGEYEFGSPVLPKLLEATLLNLCDLIDSKTEEICKGLKDTLPGEYTSRLLAFDGRSFYKPTLEGKKDSDE